MSTMRSPWQIEEKRRSNKETQIEDKEGSLQECGLLLLPGFRGLVLVLGYGISFVLIPVWPEPAPDPFPGDGDENGGDHIRLYPGGLPLCGGY